MHRLRSLCFTILFGVIFSTAVAFGQFSSSIEGTVTDSTGAIVPGAKVVLTGTATGVKNTAITNSAGFYKFPLSVREPIACQRPRRVLVLRRSTRLR